MKKRMKKMSAIALSLIMALNVCGFYCYADESDIDTCTSLEECTTLFDSFFGTKGFQLNTNFLEKDINFDGEITINDYWLIENYVSGYGDLSPLQIKFADLNGDGAVTQTDQDLYYAWFSDL